MRRGLNAYSLNTKHTKYFVFHHPRHHHTSLNILTSISHTQTRYKFYRQIVLMTFQIVFLSFLNFPCKYIMALDTKRILWNYRCNITSSIAMYLKKHSKKKSLIAQIDNGTISRITHIEHINDIILMECYWIRFSVLKVIGTCNNSNPNVLCMLQNRCGIR